MLGDASHFLHSALDGQVYLKSVSVVVPSSWRDGRCQTVIRAPKGDLPYRHADIKVSGPHPIHGRSPFTQQSRGCGQPGDFVAFPYHFLTRWNDTWSTWGDPAKLFVHEWAKLRYGIFDEFGFSHDEFYPNHFIHKGQILPTGTSNIPLKGQWVDHSGQPGCDPLEQDCQFQPSGDNTAVTCSLGYLQYLPNVTSFCTGRQLSGSPMAPTKHNVLCEGRNSLDVILGHDDFKRINPIKARSKSKNLTPELVLVREPMPQYVLVMETSGSMDAHEQWKWINKAAQKFIRYDLPVNSNLAIVTFNNQSKVEHSMVEVTGNEARARLADTLPDRYHLSRSTGRCVLCALQKVVHEVLAPENLAGTHVVLVTRGSRDTLSSPSDEKIIRNYVADYNLKMSAIVIPESDTDSILGFYDDITQSMGGKTHVVRGDGGIMEFYVGLNDAFTEVLRSDARYPTEMPVTVHEQEFPGGTSPAATGTFLIDYTLGRDTLFGIYVEDEEEHRIRSITFTDSKGNVYGPYLRMSSSYDLVNFKTINFPRGQAPPFNAVSLRFQICWCTLLLF